VAHACNPSFSGGRDQEDCSLKPVWGFGVSQTAPTWQVGFKEERYFVTLLTSECYIARHHLEREPIA
jgi:hypothetical protein